MKVAPCPSRVWGLFIPQPLLPMNRLFRNLLIGAASVALILTVGVAHFLWINQTYERGDALSFIEKATVYSGHMAMIAGGNQLGFSEVAEEAFYMHFDGPKQREWVSYFPAGSPRVRKAMDALRSEIHTGKPHATATVAWPRYTPSNGRHALALNSFDIVATDTDDGKMMYRGEVRCSYPEHAPVTITIDPFNLRLNEGVYHALEDAGWLHPYDAVWWWDGPLFPNRDVDGTARVPRQVFPIPAARQVRRDRAHGVGVRFRPVDEGFFQVAFHQGL